MIFVVLYNFQYFLFKFTVDKTDKKSSSPQDVFAKRRELQRTGGVWSNSRKRKFQERMQLDQQMHEEHEASKKYTGPVGRNPWGAIAEDYTGQKRYNAIYDVARVLFLLLNSIFQETK